MAAGGHHEGEHARASGADDAQQQAKKSAKRRQRDCLAEKERQNRSPRRTEGEAMGAVISPGLAQQLRAVWEAMNNGWNQWILNYTQSRQLNLLRNLGFVEAMATI